MDETRVSAENGSARKMIFETGLEDIQRDAAERSELQVQLLHTSGLKRAWCRHICPGTLTAKPRTCAPPPSDRGKAIGRRRRGDDLGVARAAEAVMLARPLAAH